MNMLAAAWLNTVVYYLLLYSIVIHLLPAIFLFTFRFNRRKLFALRVAAYVMVLLAISYCTVYLRELNIPVDLIAFIVMLRQLIIFVVATAGIPFMFRASAFTSVFCGVGAYAFQNMIYRVAEIILKIIDATVDISPDNYNLLGAGLRGAVYIVAYIALYFCVFKKYVIDESVCAGNRKIVVFGMLAMTVLIFFTDTGQTTDIGYIMNSLYIIITSLFILMILYSFIKSQKLEVSNRELEHMLHMKGEQFETSKETIEIINIKCHDMKHQIAALRGQADPAALDELEKAINLYDGAVKTGNDALDILLAEKSLLCQEKNIRFTCMADGKLLSFMRDVDIYSLFGNAIDNAMNAVEGLEEEKRTITISVKQSLGLVLIHIENYYGGSLEFKGGVPVTTAQNKAYHGFGVRSMRRIAESYGGYLDINAEGGIFRLNISVPANGANKN